MSILSSLSSALGVKRLIANLLTSISTALKASSDPRALALVPLIDGLAVFFGATGLVQASTKKGSLTKYGLSSLGALLLLAQYIPLLQPYLHVLQMVGLVLTGGAIGEKKKEKQLLKSTQLNYSQNHLSPQ